MTSMFILIWALLGTNFVLVLILAVVCKKYMDSISSNFDTQINTKMEELKSRYDNIHTRIDNERSEIESKIEQERNRQYEELFNTYKMFQKEVDYVKNTVAS